MIMKVLVYGSLNFDKVYQMDHFVMPKETQSSIGYHVGLGGKGLNQAIALAKSGCKVYFAGKVGNDGQPFIEYLSEHGVDTSCLQKDDAEVSGHAIIQVCHAENCIILHGGANQAVAKEDIDRTLVHFSKGDILVLQNEISSLPYLIQKAHALGMTIIFNTAPMNEKVFNCPLDLVDIFIVNEVEAQALAKTTEKAYDAILSALLKLYPAQKLVMTVGQDGSYYADHCGSRHVKAFPVKAVDTTAAGDTFIGYFVRWMLDGKDMESCLLAASKAASIAVQRIGAACSIPTLDEVCKDL